MYGATPWYQNCICTGITSGWSVTTVEAGENSQPMHLCLQGGSVQIMFETWEGWLWLAYTYCFIHWCEILYIPNLSTNKPLDYVPVCFNLLKFRIFVDYQVFWKHLNLIKYFCHYRAHCSAPQELNDYEIDQLLGFSSDTGNFYCCQLNWFC